jgi:hypothetical protein
LHRQNVVGTNACNGCTQVTALTLVPWVSRQQICSHLAQGAKVSKALAVVAAILTDYAIFHSIKAFRPLKLALKMHQGLYSQHFIFFLTYKWTQLDTVFNPGKPLQPNVL